MVKNPIIKGVVAVKEKQVEQTIIDAAIKVFVDKGKDGARMQEIADLAGVNKMLLHYYFVDKDTLFLEVIRRVSSDLYENVIEKSIQEKKFKDFLSTFIDRHFDYLDTKKETFQFLLWELSRKHFDLHDLLRNMYGTNRENPYEILCDRINDAIRTKEIRKVDPKEFIMNLFSLDLFLFLSYPVIREIVPLNGEPLSIEIEQRKKEVFRLLWNDIKNEQDGK